MPNVKFYDITPDKNIYWAIAAQGYKKEEAIAELVDNSIDASAKNIHINYGDNSLEVIDDGSGMTGDVLADAMVLGRSKKTGSLGFYGIGLKSSGLTLGDGLTVNTKPSNEVFSYEASLNKEWVLNNDWDKFAVKKSNGQRVGVSFTKVKIDGVRDNSNAGYYNGLLRDRLSQKYDSFIKSGIVKVFINGEELKPLSTPSIDFIHKKMIKTSKGDYRVVVYRLKNGSYKHAGIYINRLGRNIWWAKKELIPGWNNYLSRMYIVVDCDFCPVNAGKNNIETENETWREIKTSLMPIINDEVKKLNSLGKNSPEKVNEENIAKIVNIVRNYFKEVMPKSIGGGYVSDGDQKLSIKEGETKTERKSKKRRNRIPRINNNINVNGTNYTFICNPIKIKGAPAVSFSESGKNVFITYNQYGAIYDDSIKNGKEVYEQLLFIYGVVDFVCKKIGDRDSFMHHYSNIINQ